ncbi:MAG TPA: hypothetical protein VFO79_13755, partial [Xanthomonadales bacterium]|nr:hypothetical protein [Xanthomonadales bacterium]
VLTQYGSTPLGRIPQLDARENLELAEAIAHGELPREPFYRAPLYALTLAPAAARMPARSLPDVARAVNLLAHLLATFAVFKLAAALWKSERAALLGALLYGVHPVALHFAGDALDTSLGIGLFCAGLAAAAAQLQRPRLAVLAGLLFGLATIARPHFLPVLLCWGALSAFQSVRLAPRLGALWLTAALVAAAAPLAAIGAWNLKISGEFAVLPWQGPYNLWKANGPGANGRYFEHDAVLGHDDVYSNPTRRESELLYARATGASPPLDRHAVNRYWTSRTLAHVTANPAAWMKLMLAKAFYFANDFEQYNVRTYHVHRARLPSLHWNPLGFGLLAVAATFALVAHRAWRRIEVRGLALLAGAYLAGAMLYYASDRFRLPLAPVLAACAGGVLLRADSTRAYIAAIAAAAAIAVLSFWPLPRALRDATVHTDYYMLAAASNEVGDYAEAASLATEALAVAPGNRGAHEAACIARYNLLLVEPLPDATRMPALREARAHCMEATHSEAARQIGAVLDWSVGREAEALAVLRAQSGRTDELGARARAIRAVLHDLPVATIRAGADASAFDLLHAALAGSATACERIAGAGSPAVAARLAALAVMFRMAHPPCQGPAARIDG